MNDAGAAAAAAAIAQATKASGAIVRMESDQFLALLGRQRDPLVVCATGGFLSTKYEYMFSYKGLTFYTKSADELPLPATAEIVAAQSIWMPG